MIEIEYERLTEKECITLLQQYGTGEHIIEHCKTVASVAARIATALNQHYTVINIDAVYAGALLHDIARTEKNHANIGAKWISERGYPQIAKLIETHMQLDEQQRKQITEHTVVYLADKLVIGNREVTLRERFLDRFCQCDLESQQRVHMRYLQAVEVYRLVNNFIEEDLLSYEEIVI